MNDKQLNPFWRDRMKKTLGSILLAGVLFLAGCGQKALSAKDVAKVIKGEPTNVSVIYTDDAGSIQRTDIVEDKDLVAEVAGALDKYSTKVVKDKVTFKQKDTVIGVEAKDSTGTYNATLYNNGYMKVQKIGEDVVVYQITEDELNSLSTLWSDYMKAHSEE